MGTFMNMVQAGSNDEARIKEVNNLSNKRIESVKGYSIINYLKGIDDKSW